MKLPFRQGIVRYQRDTNGTPAFLQRSNGGSSVDLIVSPDPTVVTFAHKNANYLYEERFTVNNAWTGFTSGADYWLYIDLSFVTGERTFGHTKYQPITSSTQPSQSAIDQHWYDTQSKSMKVWNGVSYIDVLRVFLAKYDEGAVLQSNPFGSQVSDNTTSYAGHLLYDDDDLPIRKFDRRGRGEFLTSESVFSTHTSKFANVKLESLVESFTACEPIPAYSLVSKTTDGQICLADNTSVVHGLVEEDFMVSEMGHAATSGYIESDTWNWTDPVGTSLFVDGDGRLTVVVPQSGIIQRVGEVVSRHKILLKIEQPIILDES